MSTTPQSLDETRVIRGLIAEAGTTRAAVAEALHVSPETLRRWLLTPGSFTLGRIEIIAPVLGTTTEEIIRRARSAA